MATEDNGQYDGAGAPSDNSANSALKDKLVGMRGQWLAGTPEQAKKANFHAMSQLTRDVSRKILTKVSSEMIERAFADGKWVAASDASLHQRDGTSIAWAIFNPKRQLVVSGTERLSEEFGFVPAQAEAAASIRCAQELARLKAPSALCVSDCVPSIAALVGGWSEPSTARAEWDIASQGRYELSWVPREALAPANDAAREHLGLATEGGVRRQWGDWLAGLKTSDEGWEEMLRGPRGIVDAHGSSFSIKSTPASSVKKAMDENKWTAVADWAFSQDGSHAGVSVALFNSEGELKAEQLLSTALHTNYDDVSARRRTAVLAAKCLERHHAGGGVCIVSLGGMGIPWDASREPELPEGITVALCRREQLSMASIVAKIAAGKVRATGPDLNIWNIGSKILNSRKAEWNEWLGSLSSMPEPAAPAIVENSVDEKRAPQARRPSAGAAPIREIKRTPRFLAGKDELINPEAVRASSGGIDGPIGEVLEASIGKKWMILAEPCFGGSGGRMGLAFVIFDEKGELKTSTSVVFRPNKASVAPVSKEEAHAEARKYCIQRLADWGQLDAAMSIGQGVRAPKASERLSVGHSALAEGHWFSANPGRKTSNDAAVAAAGILQAQAATGLAMAEMARGEAPLPTVWGNAHWEAWMAVAQKGAVPEPEAPPVKLGRLAATRLAMEKAKAARAGGPKP